MTTPDTYRPVPIEAKNLIETAMVALEQAIGHIFTTAEADLLAQRMTRNARRYGVHTDGHVPTSRRDQQHAFEVLSAVCFYEVGAFMLERHGHP